MTREEAYLTVVEGWLRDNRGIVFTEGAVDDLCDRIASVLADNERLRAFIQGCATCKEAWAEEEARRALEERLRDPKYHGQQAMREEAAAEIRRLKAENEQLHHEIRRGENSYHEGFAKGMAARTLDQSMTDKD